MAKFLNAEPSFPPRGRPHGSILYPEMSGYFMERSAIFVHLPHRNNLISGKDSAPVLLSNPLSALKHHIFRVVLMSANKQVFRVITRSIVATMAHEKTFRYRSNESLKAGAVRWNVKPVTPNCTITTVELKRPIKALVRVAMLHYEPHQMGKLALIQRAVRH